LTRKLASIEVGETRLVVGSKDHVRALVRGERGWMRVEHPERRFELGYLDRFRTLVTRLEDLRPQDWPAIWAQARAAEDAAMSMYRDERTLVPGWHGFARWAVSEGHGRLIRGDRWWVWGHARGLKAQRAFMICLRNAGVPARLQAN
jgi:hypothetical protein